MLRRLLLLAAAALLGCSGAGAPDAGLPDVAVTADPLPPEPDAPLPCRMPLVEELDLSPGGLSTFALSFAYRCWVAEPEVHPSAGPHAETGVRTFYNDLVAASLRAGSQQHPRGSMVVKELFDGEEIIGHAINLKVEEGQGEQTWLFYEGFAPTYVGFYGIAEPTCTGCHSQGQDFVLTRVPE